MRVVCVVLALVAVHVCGGEVARRPVFHFLPAANWMNDPMPCVINNTHHLFFQYNPHGALWGDMSWGHASSKDLIHWTHHEVAVVPDQPYDKLGVFSGHCGTAQSMPPLADAQGSDAVLFYTGVTYLPIHWTLPYHRGQEQQAAAFSRDGGNTWHKSPLNPLVAAPPSALDVTGFRDPFLIKMQDTWRMVVGSGLRGFGGALLAYALNSTGGWEYEGSLAKRSDATQPSLGENWELPNLFQLNNSWVVTMGAEGNQNTLVRSNANHTAVWMVGEMDAGGFSEHEVGVADWGMAYAFNTMEAVQDSVLVGQGWANAMSLPRVLTMPLGTNKILQRPLPELAALRNLSTAYNLTNLSIDGAWNRTVPFRSRTAEIRVKFAPLYAAITRLGLGVMVDQGEGGAQQGAPREMTVILVDLDEHTVCVVRKGSSLYGSDVLADHAKKSECGNFTLPVGESLSMHVFLDNSIVEVFVNDRFSLATRVYPSLESSDGVFLTANGFALVDSLEAWELTSIWGDDRDGGDADSVWKRALRALLFFACTLVVGGLLVGVLRVRKQLPLFRRRRPSGSGSSRLLRGDHAVSAI